MQDARMKKRTLSPYIKNASKTFPVVLVSGPRQVGKTTIFDMAMEKNRTKVSLDDEDALHLAITDPVAFFEQYAPPILIDEVQYAPQLFKRIKLISDKAKKNGLFWLTGSQVFSLMKNVSETLAGRIALLNLQGFSQSEILNRPEVKPFVPKIIKEKNGYKVTTKSAFKNIWEGSFPRYRTSKKMDWKMFYSSYIKTYLERDVRQILNVSQERTFYQFLKVLAARTAQLINYNDIARDLNITSKTVKSWISVLETSGIVFHLYPYSNNITKRAIKTPKLYFFDSGLVAYLTGQNSSEVLADGPMAGAVLENYAISEIIKSYWHNAEEISAYYYRDKDGNEIDLIIELNGKLHPIEIKRTSSPSKADIKNFSVAQKLGKEIGMGAIICLKDKPILVNSEVVAVPLNYIS